MTREGESILVIQHEGEKHGPLHGVLAEWGYRAVFASTYEHGLAEARSIEPKAVLVALDAPVDDLVELVQTLQATLPTAAIAALIGGDRGDAIAQARDAGLTLTEYFVMPVDAEGLRSWLEEALEDG